MKLIHIREMQNAKKYDAVGEDSYPRRILAWNYTDHWVIVIMFVYNDRLCMLITHVFWVSTICGKTIAVNGCKRSSFLTPYSLLVYHVTIDLTGNIAFGLWAEKWNIRDCN